MGQQSMVGLLKRRRLWQQGFLLSCEDSSREARMFCSWSTTHRGNQCAQLSNIRAVHLPSPPGHEGLVTQNGGLLCFCNHCLRAMETIREDKCVGKKTTGFGQWSNKNTPADCSVRCNHADTDCYSKLLITTTSEPKSTSSSDAWSGRLPKILVCGAASALEYSSGYVGSVSHMRRAGLDVWSQRRRNPLWIERRSLSYAQTYKPASIIEAEIHESTAVVGTESETSASPSEREDEDFDFRNFPALTSSFFQDYVRPSEMGSKKRVVWQTRRKLSDTDSKLTLESIPQPRGRPYDFGLGDILSKPPPLEAGARPQGGFDIDISMEDCEGAHPVRVSKSRTVPQRMAHGNLPWNTLEAADNWSEISEDPRHSVSQGDEQALGWDQYEVDESVDALHTEGTEE